MIPLKMTWEGARNHTVCYAPNLPRSTGPHGEVIKTGKRTFEASADSLAGSKQSAMTQVYKGRSRADAQRSVEAALQGVT